MRTAAWIAGPLLAVTLVKLAAGRYIGPATPWLLYFLAVIISAWRLGWRGGLVATLGSGLLGAYLFLPPLNPPQGIDVSSLVRLGVFVVEGVALTAITARLFAERSRVDAAARQLQEAMAKLEGVLHAVADGITVQDDRGQLVYANATAAKLCGFDSAQALLTAPVSEILGRFELLDPEGQPLSPGQLPGRLALQGLPAPERLLQFRIRATGEQRWALVRAKAVRIDGSQTRFAVNVFQDVTEMRRQEDALRISQERFATTLRSIGDAVIATDAHGTITFINPVAEALTGWPAAQAEGQPLAAVFRIVDEATRAPAESPADRVLRAGKVVGLANHTVLITRDGRDIAIEDSAAPIRSSSGKVVGTVLVFRDASERRWDELRRTFLSRATTELASSLDYRSTLATVTRLAVPAFADWCAVDVVEDDKVHRLAVEHRDPAKVRMVFDLQQKYPAEPDSGRGIYEVIRTAQPMFIPDIPDKMLAAAARDPEHLDLLHQLQLRSYIAVPFLSKGTVIGVLSLAMAESGRHHKPRDLDLAVALADRATLAIEQARLFGEATQARTDAERANRAKDEFLAMLGHELRNPLAPILTALQLMKLRSADAFPRERSILERQVKHVVTLIDDLLDVSRITSGKIELAREAVDLSDTLTKAMELAGPLLEERRHQVVTEVPRGLYVSGDPVRLAQVLSNLLTNAAKYTEPGGRIQVTGTRQDDRVVLRVRDNGVGIHPDLLPRIFDLFVQGGQSLNRAQGGLGLGLAIVRNVVERHHGQVQVDSAGPGQGSEFRVILPALLQFPHSVAPTPTPVPPPRPAGARVLVVDDNQDALELLGEALTLFGYQTHTALDPVAALAQAQAVRPDVALLDIGLPVMDGYELARRLRATAGLEHLKLVAITGYGQAADKQMAREAGFDEHLVKPLSIDDLQLVLERLTSGATPPQA